MQDILVIVGQDPLAERRASDKRDNHIIWQILQKNKIGIQGLFHCFLFYWTARHENIFCIVSNIRAL